MYEIRVLNDDLTIRAIFEQQFISDGSAIRSARMLAEPRRFEVWRGPTCVSGVIAALPIAKPLTRPAA
jgi:hypothetical protein